jgi:hypothetical protein
MSLCLCRRALEGNKTTSVHLSLSQRHKKKEKKKKITHSYAFSYNVHHSLYQSISFCFLVKSIPVHNWTSLKSMVNWVRLHVFFLLNQLLEMKKTIILDIMQSKMIVRTTWAQSEWQNALCINHIFSSCNLDRTLKIRSLWF